MTVKYVVSFAGALLYFNAERQPAEPLPSHPNAPESKPDVKLIPPSQHRAAGSEWDEALGSYTPEQRGAAEISELV